MLYNTLGRNRIKVSRVGIGGHYKAMEEGSFEDRYAYVDREIESRIPLVRRALEAGVNYFDTTWRNETALLGQVLQALGARGQAVVNGMVLGVFTGSKAAGVSIEQYFNRWLDARLPLMPDGRFDVFMLNAIEEGYDEAGCERLIKLMDERRAKGDIDVLGFSTHDPFLARRVADRFPEFEAIMLPYNYHNRRFEEAFAGYTGSAGFIAMKTQVWLEYGIPFCAINALPAFTRSFGFEPAPDASTRALRFVHANPLVTTAVCAVNSPAELENLIQAGSGEFTPADEQVLRQYQAAVSRDHSIPLYLGGLRHENLRMNYFGAMHLARVLGVPMPEIPLNESDSQERILDFAAGLIARVCESDSRHYLEA
jgi:aryl-alcohol dehydrogenase-like predicted oxidoreductase